MWYLCLIYDLNSVFRVLWQHNNVLPFTTLHWTLFKNPPTLEEILYSTNYIADVDKNIMNILDEEGLLD
jgi:hypothetical protein